ncbi:MAG TPA: response regulator transcription factor [Anaerolineales bacterium]|nr:response regulator transcription factor [Anaerolineales bacterium]
MGSDKRSVGMDRPDPHPRRLDKSPPESPAGIEPHLNPLKVLVVENVPEVVDKIIVCVAGRWPDSVLIVTASGMDAVQIAQTTAPDIVLLGLALADLYGQQVLGEIRGFSDRPVIMLSPSYMETIRLRSVGIGATDYLVVDPFSPVEFLGSVHAALGYIGRGRQPRGQSLVINLASHCISRSGIESSLSTAESKILAALLCNHGRIVSRARLMQEGRGKESVARASLAMYIKQLRLKLGDDPQQPRLIHLHRNLGYSLALFD